MEAFNFWNELLFGVGGILGFILIFLPMFYATAKIRFAGFFCSVVAFVLALQYVEKLASDSTLWWLAIVSFVMVGVYPLMSVYKEKED